MQPTCNRANTGLIKADTGRKEHTSRAWLGKFSWEGALGNGFIILTGGAFLTSLALYFGAGDFEIGLLCAIPFLAQIAQMFSGWLINLTGSRKHVTLAGFLLGGPEGGRGIIPNEWVSSMVGGNSLLANFFASFVGAFMYFATLTEVPILEGLINAGMGKGPALALLLAGPALSLPNMLVIRSVMGTQKTLVFIGLVITLSTVAGMTYGALF